MRIIDVDAHLHEPLDWVERTDPELADALGPPARFFLDMACTFDISYSTSRIPLTLIGSMPASAQPLL